MSNGKGFSVMNVIPFMDYLKSHASQYK